MKVCDRVVEAWAVNERRFVNLTQVIAACSTYILHMLCKDDFLVQIMHTSGERDTREYLLQAGQVSFGELPKRTKPKE